jgi:hypothetical protein
MQLNIQKIQIRTFMNLIYTYNSYFSQLIFQKVKTLLLLAVFTVSSFSGFSQSTSSISSCSDFVVGNAAAWPYVLVATTIDSGSFSQGSQTYSMTVTSLPVGGANFRVYKTVANGNDFFGNLVVLTLGVNTITVPAVSFDRAVKFQFSDGSVEFDALSLNGVASSCVATLPPPSISSISSCGDFVSGTSVWPYVLIATTLADGASSQGSQTYSMNVTSLPAGGANFRVYKTTANGNDFFGNPVALILGVNTITVPAVGFDRAVKFQFSDGSLEFDALSLNGVASSCVANATAIEIPEYYVTLNTFPNPSNGDLFIVSNDPIESLEIRDLSGRVVFEMEPQKNKIHIQTSKLKNSFYFLSCFINQEWVSRKIILNQR